MDVLHQSTAALNSSQHVFDQRFDVAAYLRGGAKSNPALRLPHEAAHLSYTAAN